MRRVRLASQGAPEERLFELPLWTFSADRHKKVNAK